MSDFTGTHQREVGNRGELGGGLERVCHRLLSLDRQQKKACAIIIHLSPFSSHGPIFFFLIPARTGAARTSRAPPDSDSIMTEKARDSYLVRQEPDRFLTEVREVAVVVVRDRKRESPSRGKRELMSELKRTRWSDPL